MTIEKLICSVKLFRYLAVTIIFYTIFMDIRKKVTLDNIAV